MKGARGKSLGAINRRGRDELIGKIVYIIGGEWKGFRG